MLGCGIGCCFYICAKLHTRAGCTMALGGRTHSLLHTRHRQKCDTSKQHISLVALGRTQTPATRHDRNVLDVTSCEPETWVAKDLDARRLCGSIVATDHSSPTSTRHPPQTDRQQQ